jgi:type II secretory ATPase GspE/PulE/Tfp pilus assembly ATPase PilB-like protein
VRGNPDVMSLGEIRSAASARAAVMLAEIGCLLFGTTHAHSCLGIFQRLISIGVDIYSLTAPGIMNLFIHQSLVPVLCKSCRVPLAAMPAETRNAMRDIGSRLDVCTDGMYYQNLHSACQYCRGTGIRGRTVVCEMIQHDVKLLDFILRRDLHAAEKYWHERSDGRYDTSNFTGKSSFYHAFILAQRGVISPDEVCKFGFFDDFSAPSTQRATSCQEVVP